MSRCDGCGSCSQGLSGTGESCSAGGCALTQHPNNVSIFHVLLGRQWPRVLAQSGHRDLAMGLRVGAGHRRGGAKLVDREQAHVSTIQALLPAAKRLGLRLDFGLGKLSILTLKVWVTLDWSFSLSFQQLNHFPYFLFFGLKRNI